MFHIEGVPAFIKNSTTTSLKGEPSIPSRVRTTVWNMLATLIALVVLTGHAHSDSYTWTGKGNSNNWEEPKNWNPNGVPGSAAEDDDEASIAQTPATLGIVHLNGNVSIR